MDSSVLLDRRSSLDEKSYSIDIDINKKFCKFKP